MAGKSLPVSVHTHPRWAFVRGAIRVCAENLGTLRDGSSEREIFAGDLLQEVSRAVDEIDNESLSNSPEAQSNSP
jgi:hypothetical protein